MRSQADASLTESRVGPSLGSDSPLYRVFEIRDYLASTHEPVTRNHLASRFDVSRHTIYRDLAKVEQITPISETPDGKIFIARQDYLANVHFSIHEAMAVYLAARLLITRMDRRNKHATSALRKLAKAFAHFAPEISRQMAHSAQAVEDKLLPSGSVEDQQDRQYQAALETLTRAMADRKKVRFGYRKDENSPEKEHTLSPYFIEPYAIGQTTYVVGQLENKPKLYTFKVERITRAELLAETYLIPPEFNIADYLADAWGIWTSSQEPVPVSLRFCKEVAFRVKETRWHSQQEIEELPDGALLWRSRVANPTEMLPWIKSWGAQVVVLEPADLRAQLAEEARRLVELYSHS